MSFNMTFVGFGSDPDTSDEQLLLYRGFDKDLLGKVTNGRLLKYLVTTEVAGVVVHHVQVLDECVDSDNLVVVFEKIALNVSSPFDAGFQERLKLMTEVLTETALRAQCTDPSKIKNFVGPDGSIVYCLLGVKKAIEDDCVKASRDTMASINTGN